MEAEQQDRGLALRALLAGYAEHDPWIAAWRAYPDVAEEIDDAMPDCVPTSRSFTAFARGRGWDAITVVATVPSHPDATDLHAWTVLNLPGGGSVGVDWTARQMWNIDRPRNPAHADIPCPTVWDGALPHPVVEAGYTELAPDTGPA